MKHLALTAPLVLLLLVTLSGCGSAAGNTTKNRTLNVTLPSEPATADPNKSTDTNSGNVIAQTMEGLYTYDQNGKIVAGVATKVVKPTNNGKTYTFNLRQNAKWANGQAVTAQDFVTSLRRWVDPKTKAQYANKLSAIKGYAAIQNGKAAPSTLGVKALSTTKLQITLSQAVPYFDDLVSDYYPLNTATVKKYGQKYGTNATKTMSNGAYKLVGWTGSNSSWTYVKNPHYWNAKHVKIKQVKVNVTKDDSTAANLFKSGKIQETTVSGQYVRANANNRELHKTLQGRLQYLYVNSQKTATNSEDLRQAISYVTNRETLTSKVLQDGSKPALNAVPRGDQANPKTGEDMATQLGNLLPTDVAKAKAYWAKYLKATGKTKVTLNLLTDDTDDDKHVGAYLQSVMEKNFKGLTVTTTSIPHAQHVARDFAGTFELNLTGWSTNLLDASDFLNLAAKGNTVNFTGWNDDTFNARLAKASTQTGLPRYNTLMDANQRLMAVKGYIPLYQPSQAKLVSKDVGGLKDTLLHAAQYKYGYWK